MEAIERFVGKYHFLSNFYIESDGSTVEHQYQASKATNIEDYMYVISQPTPGKAKHAGRKIRIRPEWETIKLIVMEELLRKKFSNLELAQKLLETGSTVLVEGNAWGDTFWGVYEGKGQNHLGILLMKIRDEYLQINDINQY